MPLLLGPPRYDFVAPYLDRNTLTIVRYTDGEPARTLFRTEARFLSTPTDRSLMGGTALLEITVNFGKTMLLVPQLIESSEEPGAHLKYSATVVGLDGKVVGEIPFLVKQVQEYATCGWLDAYRAAVIVEGEEKRVTIFDTRNGRLHSMRDARFEKPKAQTFSSKILINPMSVMSPYVGSTVFAGGKYHLTAYEDEPCRLRLYGTVQRFAANWNGRKVYWSPPEGLVYQHARPMRYPWIVARRTTGRDNPILGQFSNLGIDPYIDSDLYLINMATGITSKLGPGILPVSLTCDNERRRDE